ncbi:HAD-IB family hydrolase [Candidatus Saccharibacteria bacterium]|nr:HAD-IB family hydrolase [Candidatus Saccharibacteria bacterium]
MVKQKFAAFDIDGTLFRSGLYREVAYELMKLGAVPPEMLEEVTLKNREWRHRTHGNAFEEFELLLVDHIDHLLPQLRIDDFEEAAQMVLEKRADNVYIYTRNLIKKLKDQGYFLIAISGSQIELVEPFATKYGFDTWIGQHWERGDKYFTGNVVKTHTGKDKILQDLVARHNLTYNDSYAIGDSNGDAGMLRIVEHPIAFNPTYELYEHAVANGWQMTIERKNVIYTLQHDTHGSHILASAEHQ